MQDTVAVGHRTGHSLFPIIIDHILEIPSLFHTQSLNLPSMIYPPSQANLSFLLGIRKLQVNLGILREPLSLLFINNLFNQDGFLAY
mmetsp:Transcript_3224/g.7544  ORF Transcript_3224/g.7544 Transcript_3224/m.7544 type:complete len:87 (+) Transcript_3224:118-378(+)